MKLRFEEKMGSSRLMLIVFSIQGDLRHGLLLCRHHHRSQPDFWCHHRHLRGSEVGEAAEGRDHQELVLHMR